jgi:starch phosphorylase
VGDYLRRFYLPAAGQGRRIVKDEYATARDLAAWKERVRNSWDAVKLRALETPKGSIQFGDTTRVAVGVQAGGLEARDIVIELLLRSTASDAPPESRALAAEGKTDQGEERYVLDLAPELSGKLEYRIRAYPFHPALTHRFEMGRMKWL